MNFSSLTLFAHAFGQRYELPIPLALFVFGGAFIVLLSFLIVLPTKVSISPSRQTKDHEYIAQSKLFWTIASFIVFIAFEACGIYGSQTIPENIVPTLFWLIIWIAVPLSCGILGDWTQQLNIFAHVARLVDRPGLRKLTVGQEQPLKWPTWLAWWPAAILFFLLACGELIYNQVATLPAFISIALLIYLFISAFAGLIFSDTWLKRGEIFSVLFSTWGRLGYFRFGAEGTRGFAGGLKVDFDISVSRTAFVLLLLVSVSFDGLLATPSWSHFEHQLPHSMAVGTIGYQLLATAIFAGLALVIWGLFTGFATVVRSAGHLKNSGHIVLTELLPSLLPISFGYLLAHNIEYLAINSQLLFPLIGNPTGLDSWPIHLIYPFNDSFEPNVHLFPSSFYWYFSVVVIILVHIIAVVLAHRKLSSATKNISRARSSEYPWVVAMVLYTMLSLWLLAQPLVKEVSMSQKQNDSAVAVLQYSHVE